MKVDVEALAQQIADGAWAELGPKIEALKADHDAHRRQLQARNTELVEENRRLRALLVGVVRLAPLQDWPRRGNAPGHAHAVRGVWDDDNGALAGTRCEWCEMWARVQLAAGGGAP